MNQKIEFKATLPSGRKVEGSFLADTEIIKEYDGEKPLVIEYLTKTYKLEDLKDLKVEVIPSVDLGKN